MSRVVGAACVSVAALVACGGQVVTTRSSSSQGGAASKANRDGAFSSSAGGFGGASTGTRHGAADSDGSIGGRGGRSAGPDAGTGSIGDTGGAATFGSVDLTSGETQVWVGEIDRTVTFEIPLIPDSPEPEHVVLVLKGSDDVDQGSLVIGSDPPPPKATDPNVFYPPLTLQDGGAGTEEVARELMSSPYDGFPYSLLALDRTETSVTFQIAPAELYTDWCALQTHITVSAFEDMLACGRADVTLNEDYYQSHDLDTAYLCDGNGYSACRCDQTGCHALTEAPGVRWTISLGAQNGLLEGQMWELLGSSQIMPNLRLKRLR